VVAILDTVIVPGDTIDREIVTTERDTIEIYKDRVRTRIIRSFDTLQVYTECPADTIVREVKVKCPPQVVAGPMGLKWWIWLIIGFGISLLLFLFITSRR
jgi:hypothetical protein